MNGPPLLEVFVPGEPIPRPSARMWKRRRWELEWSRTVAWTARSCMVGKPLLDEPLELHATFYTTHAGDLSNFLKLVEDALNKVVYTDDRFIRRICAEMVKQKENQGVQLSIYQFRPRHSPPETRTPPP